MKFQKLIIKFPWTTIGTLLVNVVTLTTLIVVAVQEGYGLDKVISVLPRAFLIMNMAALMVFPCIDLYETLMDRKMCKVLGADYQKEFLPLFNEEEKEIIRENYKSTNSYKGLTLHALANKKQVV